MRMRISGIGLSIVALGGMLAIPAIAADETVADFYNGKNINLSIGYGAGGGYDLYGRLAGRHIGNFIPGKPTVVVRNVPGAGSIKLANQLHAVAPKDGTELGVIGQAVAVEQALGRSGIKYDAAGFNWIGRLTSNNELNFVWHTSATKTIEDAMKRETVLGGTGPSSASVAFPRLLANLLDVKFRVVAGYQGSSEVMLAIERGEVEGGMASLSTLKKRQPQWLKENKVNIIIQYGLERHPELPNVPTIVDLARTDTQRDVLSFFASSAAVGRAVMATPGIPAPRVAALRDAFKTMTKDAAFLEEVRKSNIDFDPLDGEALQKVVEKTLSLSPDVLAEAKKAANIK